MHIRDIFERNRTTFSFEFFPPKTDEGTNELFLTIQRLQALKPSFVSVTYGAGGSTHRRTHDLVVRIYRELQITAISHLTCVCHTREELHSILDRYAASGVENILALSGDPPANNSGYDRSKDAFRYAEELVRFIKSFGGPPEFRGFGVGVAGFPEGHPATKNRLKEMDFLKKKADAGAEYVCTQTFLDNRDFYDFRERCELAGIKVPIIAGIMPVTSRANLARMSELALGARTPASLLRSLGRCKDDHAIEMVGKHWATEQCRDLLDNQVRGIHFYTLNRSETTLQIYKALGVVDSTCLEALTKPLVSA
ncbi:methylenetetrahydrofolate reductase [NAD(P)H] [Zavarzinella formosa]|uniref:methylenetetrahydrofolate reductase [NAD(P)H] n=1 Tax=Zavarzinella formosa TaxID=360055 RepID=UPI0003047C4E|nr:methylenetetrahydrofolate reductase [NAD(P)H] [Zavarzinella formosa]